MLTVYRCFDILELLAKESKPVLLNDIAKELNLSRASAHNFLKAMVDRGYVSHVAPRKGFTLGNQILYLSENMIHLNIKARIRPYCQKLNELTGESIYFALFKNKTVDIILSILSSNWLALGDLGKIENLHTSSLGKVLLSSFSKSELNKWLNEAYLPQINANSITDKDKLYKEIEWVKKRGYAVNREEFEIGACSVSAPVKDKKGKVFGTITIGFPSVRANEELWSTYSRYVIDTSADITRQENIIL